MSSSFIEGLNPIEYYAHAMAGREGICDTATGTAVSGYQQRRITKITEDISIQYDGTVRDHKGKIYQFAYGGNGLNPKDSVMIDGVLAPCDMKRMFNRLNLVKENRDLNKPITPSEPASLEMPTDESDSDSDEDEPAVTPVEESDSDISDSDEDEPTVTPVEESDSDISDSDEDEEPVALTRMQKLLKAHKKKLQESNKN